MRSGRRGFAARSRAAYPGLLTASARKADLRGAQQPHIAGCRAAAAAGAGASGRPLISTGPASRLRGAAAPQVGQECGAAKAAIDPKSLKRPHLGQS